MIRIILTCAVAILLSTLSARAVEKDPVSGLNLPPANTLADNHVDSLLTSNKVIFTDGKPAPAEVQQQVDSIRRRISLFITTSSGISTTQTPPISYSLAKMHSWPWVSGGRYECAVTTTGAEPCQPPASHHI